MLTFNNLKTEVQPTSETFCESDVPLTLDNTVHICGAMNRSSSHTYRGSIQLNSSVDELVCSFCSPHVYLFIYQYQVSVSPALTFNSSSFSL
jgi:hypothetical protein